MKYVPDGFLNEAQKQAKREALAEDAKKAKGDKQETAKAENAKKYSYKDILMLARDRIADYKTLDAPGQSAVRMTMRQALAHGMSEQDALMYARVSAHTGIRVVFDKMALARDEETQELIYADGFYNPRANEIVVNPEGKRSAEALLVHELTHAIYRTVDGRLILEREVRNLSEAEKQKITNRYAKVGQRSSLILMDEMNAHYAEGLLANKNTLARLLDEKPTLSDRILSFFRSAKKDYAQDKRLSRSAEKLLRHYKTLFDNFSAQNRANLGLEAARVEDGGDEGVRFSIQDGKVVIDTDRDIFKGVDRKDYGRTVRTYMRLHFRGKMFSETAFTKVSEREYTSSRSTQGLYHKQDGIYEAKMQASTELDNIILASSFIAHENAEHPHEYNQKGYDRYSVEFSIDGETFTGEMLVSINSNNKCTFYDIVKIKRSASPVSAGIAERGASASVDGDNSVTVIIPETERKSNPSDKNSFEKISEGRFALPEEGGAAEYALENEDISWYNEIKIPYQERTALQSEALTWDAKYRNELRRRTLSNGVRYLYMLDDDGLVHVYGREASRNIHERGDYYANSDGQELNTIAESLRSGQRGDGGYNNALRNGRESGEADTEDHSSIRFERSGKRKGNSLAATFGNRKKKAIRYQFDQDGSGHGTVTYSDGSKVRFALPEEGGVSYAELMSLENVTAFDPAAVLAKGAPREVRQAAVSIGGLKKALANARDSRVYNKKDALAIVERFEGVDFLTLKARDEIADMLWQGLHDCRDNAARKVFARDNRKTELLRRNLLQKKPLQILRILLGSIIVYLGK